MADIKLTLGNEPAPAAPTEAELLQSILEELKKQNAANAAEKKD